MRFILICISLFFLVGCGSLNFRTAPLTMENCHYASLNQIQFQLNPLSSNITSYQHINIAPSRSSRHLSATYAGMKGKLTGNIIVRHYPKETFWRAPSLLERASLYDDGYDDLYISPAQRAARDRKAKFVAREAILQNCQIIYIVIDSLAEDSDNPKLIVSPEVSIIQ